MFDKQKGTLRMQDVDANLVISNVVNTFRLKVERYGGKITTSFNAEDAIVNVDEMHFTNVIFNLLDNALKYRNEERPLELKVETRDVARDRLEIVVADNGIGIGEEHLPHIFERFYRIDKGRSRKQGGTGLGLAIVKNAVAIHGGTITARERERGGLEFVFTLKKHS